MTQILLAPSADLAKELLASRLIPLTVEAEYGAYVAEGTSYTAAHHQPAGTAYAGRHVGGSRPSPCNDANIPVVEEGVILVSHVDLDTLGGVWRAQGRNGLFLRFSSFWDLAEFVDVNGPHRVDDAGASEEDVARLYAWWAHSKSLPRLPRDRVEDITELVNASSGWMAAILEGDEAPLAAGKAFRSAEADLNRRTFRGMSPGVGVITRVAESASDFCNHLYADPEGRPGGVNGGEAAVVVCHNTATGAITLSISEPLEGFSCRELVQDLWGPEAGGHDGIAGSPRGRVMTETEFGQLVSLADGVLCDCLSAEAFDLFER